VRFPTRPGAIPAAPEGNAPPAVTSIGGAWSADGASAATDAPAAAADPVAASAAANPLAPSPVQPSTGRSPDGVRPRVTLGLLAVAHAVNHAQAALLPLVYLLIIDEFHVGAAQIAFLTAIGSLTAGLVQLAYSGLTRVVSRKGILVAGGILFGGGMAAQALAPTFAAFSIANVLSKVGGSPQHPVGNALIAEQFAPRRRGFAISVHIAGGNVGTIAIPLVGTWLLAGVGWRITVVLFGVPAILIALVMVPLIRESGADRAAARAGGTLRTAFGSILRDRDLLWIYVASMIAAGGRGLGILNLFVPLYLARVAGLDAATVGIMYAVFLLGSVPAPLVAGWLSDRIGRKPVILGAYFAGAASLAVFAVAGTRAPWLWVGIVLMSAFSFVESPQLQSLLADVAPARLRDVAFSTYFTLAFGVGSLWAAVFGAVIGVTGEATGLPLVFWIMAGSFVVAGLACLPIRAPGMGRESAAI
jgi:MFS transporter, FSR family, fosmidomycin resistance protein